MPPRRSSLFRARVGDLAESVGMAVRVRADSALQGARLRAQVEFARRMDTVASIVNSLTGFGTSRDQSVTSRVSETRQGELLKPVQLSNVFRFNGYARRYLSELADGMTSEGWELVDGDTRLDLVAEEERRLFVYDRVREALEEAFEGGGALIVILTDDPSPSYEDPLEPDDVVKIRALLVLDRHEFTPDAWEQDPESSQYRKPSRYFLSPRSPGGIAKLSGLRVHWSRCLYIPGRKVTSRVFQERNGIDDPLVEAVLPELFNLQAIDAAGGIAATRLLQDVLKIQGLGELEQGKLWEATETRIRAISAGQSAVNMTLLSDGDEFHTREASATGYRELRDGAKSAWSAVTGMPQTKAFGDAPSGLRGGKDEAGERAWAGTVRSWQESHLRRVLERLYALIIAQDDVEGDAPESWELHFVSLVKLTQAEEAALRESTARTDAIGIDAGWLDANEVRAGRFGPDGWKFDLPELVGELDDPPPPPMPPGPFPPAPDDDDDDDTDTDPEPDDGDDGDDE